MSDTPPNTTEQLDSIISEYLESVERGQTPDPKRWIERYPEFANELEAFFAAEAQFDRLVTPFRNSSPVTAPAPGNGDTAILGPAVPTDAGSLPRALGGYDLLSELGRGGMGVIYEARQRSLNRLVAIKMIRSAEWATTEERMRFRWEAETVAALDHPNIVPIYEVGEVVSEGARLPFFSMKLIEGENLLQARERLRNDWKSIARLMDLVTRAVEHAHQRGVLHRDLKPANVLLGISTAAVSNEERQRGSGFLLGTSFVTPHISDFGLARRIQHQHGGTVPGAIIGTPSYLAPELTLGHEFATSASDVYSLGAILYELLTGVPPFQGATPLETIQLVASNAVKAPRKVNPAVPPDLETICLKCLETAPDKRYPSADKLAEDLEHFMANRPIAARPIGRAKRLARWARRQPVIAGLSAALVLVVLVSLPLIVWNWLRAVEQEHIAEARLGEAQQERSRAVEQEHIAENHRTEAQQERDRADEAFVLAHGALTDVFRLLAEDRWDEMPGSEQAKKQLLENGLKYYRTFVERHRDDPKLRHKVAQALFESGMLATRMGTRREAVESYETAVAQLRSWIKEHPDETELRAVLARTLGNLGNALGALNRLNEAVAAHEESAELWARIRTERPDSSEAVTAQAKAWMNRGVVFQVTEDWVRVLESAERGRALLTEHGLAAKEQYLTIMLLLNVSQAEERLGRQDDAVREAREAVRLADLMLKAAPRAENARLAVAYSGRVLGHLSWKKGNLEDAKTNLQPAQKVLADLHRQQPRMTEYTWNLSLTCEDLAELAEREKRFPDAVNELLRAEALVKELVERDKESHPNRANLARIERHLARLYQELNNPDATRKAYEQAKVQLEYLLDHNSLRPGLRSDLAGTCHQLGVAYSKLKKHPEAAAAAEEAVKNYRILLDRSPKDGHVRKNLSSVLGNVAIHRRLLQQYPEALRATEDRTLLWPDGALESYDAATEFARIFEAASRATERAAPVEDRALKGAISALRQAIKAGFADREKIRTDARFAPLRETAEFQAFLKEVGAGP